MSNQGGANGARLSWPHLDRFAQGCLTLIALVIIGGAIFLTAADHSTEVARLAQALIAGISGLLSMVVGLSVRNGVGAANYKIDNGVIGDKVKLALAEFVKENGLASSPVAVVNPESVEGETVAVQVKG